MGMSTGQGETWTTHRVCSLRRVHGFLAYRSAEKTGAAQLSSGERPGALGDRLAVADGLRDQLAGSRPEAEDTRKVYPWVLTRTKQD
jgi:hypothetical protein